jgi:hypothetical protein
MTCSIEVVRIPWHTDRDPHTTVCRYDFENNVEDREDNGFSIELPCFDNRDEVDSECYPLEIMRQVGEG